MNWNTVKYGDLTMNNWGLNNEWLYMGAMKINYQILEYPILRQTNVTI